MKAPISTYSRMLPILPLLALSFSTAISAQVAATRPHAWGAVSSSLQSANDLGRADLQQEIKLSLQLTPQNSEALEKAAAERADPTSALYHKWMTDAELKAYAPTQAQIKTLVTELESHGLKVLSTGSDNLSLRVSGSVANVESAFHTELHQFRSGTHEFRANTKEAFLSGEANQYISSIGGLESHTIKPMIRKALDARTHEALKSVPLSKVKAASGGLSSYITDIALSSPTTYTFTTPGAALPYAVYVGNQYDVNPNIAVSFTPTQLQAAYGLPAAYAAGLTGKGETIVLLEAYGDSHMLSDANAFASLTGLPQLTSSTFSVVYPEGPIPNADAIASLTGWDMEIGMDIEWAHTIAPAAKILVVAAYGQDSETFQNAITFITQHNLGYVVSDSWEEDTDLIAGPVEQEAFEDVLWHASLKGISFQFSTGDGGDEGLGTPLGAPGVPSNAPHATAVGGTAILNKLTGGFEPVGWGDTISYLDDEGILVPGSAAEFLGGGGGGESVWFPKPSWQKSLPGTGRQTPDVSALADPYTGVPIVVSVSGTPTLFVGYGGTSLASPLVTAFLALAEQKAGEPLGQAAPLIASLSSSAITDVLPLSSTTDVAGAIFTSSGPIFVAPATPFGGLLYDTTSFISGMWNLSSLAGFPVYIDFAFATDTSLTVTSGWDNATGYGTPNGLPFINGVAAAATKK